MKRELMKENPQQIPFDTQESEFKGKGFFSEVHKALTLRE
jgi:hypothetical protein